MKIGILGGGESGVGAALLAKETGNEVFVSDIEKIKDSFRNELINHNIRFEEGGHSFEKLESFDLIIKSPGIPNYSSLVTSLKSKGKVVIGEIEFAYRHSTGKIIGITGTNGKTTTTNLTFHMMKLSEMNVAKGGNLGKSFSRLILEGYEWYVLELSSFQLEDIVEFRPEIAALLNISADHLDRYEDDISKYLEAKMRICINQSSEDVLLIPKDEWIVDKTANGSMRVEIVEVDDIMGFEYLKGEHNQINAAFAKKIAQEVGVTESVINEGIKTFVNEDHRLQIVGRINEVLYVNDSKATNVEAVYHALRAFEEPIIWIVGGEDKGNDYVHVSEEVTKRVKHIVALGIDNNKIINYFNKKVKSIVEAKSMKEAIMLSASMAESGDVVLLSPACASFDLFKNYEDRGEQFIKETWNILKNKENS